MIDVIWKCFLTGIIVGGAIGYFEAQGSKDAKAANESIEGALADIFAPPRKVVLASNDR